MQQLSGAPTVLIVDDEELMLEVTSIMVEEHGGSVLTASSGDEAVRLVREKNPSLNCVILDFSMPGRNGYETFSEIDKLIPGIPAVVISGLACTNEIKALSDAGRLEFLGKPFQEAELIAAINRALDSKSR